MQQRPRDFIFRAGLATSLLAIITLAACGGGGAGSSGTATATATPSAVSSGTVTAFGSIFVNGHEFSTASAKVIDDDTGATVNTAALEVGMSVDVTPASTSTTASPVAAEVHLHPLARGVVDGSNTTAGTLVVMGQTVQITAATNFSDHRACLKAATPCAPITGQTGLTATTGSGTGAAAGSYVGVHGYLYTSASGANQIVATLVSVGDPPAAPGLAAYKAEGVVTAVGSSAVTIGGLSIDLSTATCLTAGETTTSCANAFSVGQTVAAMGSVVPALPATRFVAGHARLRSKLFVSTDGAAIELEGQVSAVTASPASFVMRGVTVDASALTSGVLPALGDVVEVTGTVAAGGTSVSASAVTLLHAARAATYGLEGDIGSVAAGSTSGTWLLTLLGQPVNITASTRLADRSVDGENSGSGGSSGQSFNITTFNAYLTASTSHHVIVRAQADSTGALNALSVTLLPASTVAAVGGTIDATPVPVNGTAGGAPTTFAVHGLTVSADASAVLQSTAQHEEHGFGGSVAAGTATVAVGDLVQARGTYAAGTLTVGPLVASGGSDGLSSLANVVIDWGAVTSKGHDGL